MQYLAIDCHPSTDKIQELLDTMSGMGWALKSTLTGLITSKHGWVTFIFERAEA